MKYLWLVAAWFAATAYAQSPAGNAASGKDLFFKFNCYGCHGYSGQNGPGNRLVPMKMSQAAFTAYVRNPSRMPAYLPKVLTDAQLGDIWAYVKTLPEAPPIKDIPLLQEILNQQ